MATYRTRTYIAGDWDNDKDAVDQLHTWNDSNYWSLSFTDAHDLTSSRDSSLGSTKIPINESNEPVAVVHQPTVPLCDYRLVVNTCKLERNNDIVVAHFVKGFILIDVICEIRQNKFQADFGIGIFPFGSTNCRSAHLIKLTHATDKKSDTVIVFDNFCQGLIQCFGNICLVDFSVSGKSAYRHDAHFLHQWYSLIILHRKILFYCSFEND